MSHKKAKLLRKLRNGSALDAVKTPVKAARRSLSSSVTVVDSIGKLTPEQKNIFFPVLEDLTDDLIDELSARFKRQDLIDARRIGMKYNRKRDSLMTGTRDLSDFDDDDDGFAGFGEFGKFVKKAIAGKK